MEINSLIGFGGAILIGISLGMIGGGGSILTVPILVYLLGIEPVLATAYSLFVVGSTSLVGAGSYLKRGKVSYRIALVFALPSFLAIFLMRKYVVHALPEVLFALGGFTVSKNLAIMVFFAAIMLLAAYSMIKNGTKLTPDSKAKTLNYPLIALQGLVEGSITGIVGAGGGFLIIPALVLIAKLPMRMAVGTSLLIIGIKSLLGFTGDLISQDIDWSFLLIFTGLSIVGIFMGGKLSRKVNESALKKAFGWFVLLMGGYILIRELAFG
ncbi:sulfite exporter TauE/SafE family protein [Echinicola vietnamensis]|uniref:Probable membrane transporter protein n=1 Tax=Echinicola vietnamensis (strain DSM 17526 / LMG 23754 / KMM 6221) TaxID=926556 RepID=L0G142_ECHVK|nr:sulfite exporter TauE/SafE family protein [Echinicola vietnamensis]AGA78540.1 putative permease [Echinicola vietnamensis DSM 17526]